MPEDSANPTPPPASTPLPPPVATPPASSSFKPNIYPVMYWALAYGVVAGLLLYLIYLFSQYITLIWFPVFLAGLIWGGWRNYKKQKRAWTANSGVAETAQTPVEEFKQAVSDIAAASRDLMNQPAAPETQEADPEEEE